MEQRRIVFVIFDGFRPLDMVGPHEVFSYAARHGGGYACEIVAASAGLVRSASGLPVHAASGVQDSSPDGVDTLVIAGGADVDRACHDERLVSWIAAAGTGARRATSVCSGVFLLAAAGLVTGRTVTTHWGRAELGTHRRAEAVARARGLGLLAPSAARR